MKLYMNVHKKMERQNLANSHSDMGTVFSMDVQITQIQTASFGVQLPPIKDITILLRTASGAIVMETPVTKRMGPNGTQLIISMP